MPKKCVNINTQEETFTCDNCDNRAPFSGSSKFTRSHHIKASSTSKSSIIRRKNLELQRLEEERQLAIERDNVFLKLTYQFWQQEANELYDRCSIDINYVHEWFNNKSNLANLYEVIRTSVTPLNVNVLNCSTKKNNVSFAHPISSQGQVATQSLCLKWTGNVERNENSRLWINVAGPNNTKSRRGLVGSVLAY